MGGPAPVPLIPYPDWLSAPAPVVLPPPPWGTGGPGAPGSATNPLTTAQAEALFKEMAGQPHIPFNWPADGCYARAHEMRRLMAEKGIESAKVFNYGSLSVTSPSIPDGGVTWRYHVAPTIEVQQSDGSTKPMVIDPSLSQSLMTPQEWKDKQGDPGSRLEPAGGHAVYKPEGVADNDPRVNRDDTYEDTKKELEHFRRERAAWDAAHPSK